MLRRTTLSSVLCLLAVACGDSEPMGGDPMGGSIEITGSWMDNFGGFTEITASAWGDQAIISHDNEANWAITQNAPDAMFNPSQFNRVVWTEPVDGLFWVCTVDFGLATAEAAMNTTKTADASAPATMGCGAFSWSRFSEPLNITGTWDDNFGGTTSITNAVWGEQAVIAFDASARWAVTQNPADAQWMPNTFNRVVWTDVADNVFHVCTVDFALATVEAARTSTQTADATDPDNSGCGMFTWTRLERGG